MNENSVITKTRRRKLCMAASDPEKPLAVITHVAFGNGGVNESGEPLVPLETQPALNSELWWLSKLCIPKRRMKMSASPSSLMMNFDLEVTAHGRRVLHSPGKSGV